MKDNKILDSVNNSGATLMSLLKSLYKGMPVLMVSFTFLMIFLAEKIGSNTTIQLGMLTVVIFFSSVVVYFRSKNYGEAVLALSAGLFTVYTVNWTTPLFISFIVVWVAFTVIVFLSTSIKLASQSQSIYLEASFAVKNKSLSDKDCEKALSSISDALKDSILGPIEKAEVIRVFAYKKIEMTDMAVGLKWVNIFFALTRIPYLVLADFVAVVIKNTSIIGREITCDRVFDYIYTGMRNASVSPNEYIEAFQQTRHILVRHKQVVLYFNTLVDYFDSGVSPQDIEEFFNQALTVE